jgi:hypothetical protein
VKDADEKERILRSLKNIVVSTKEECVNILNSFIINTKILCFLPGDDKSDINFEIANEILNLLINFSENLFCRSSNEEECIQFRSKLEECDCFNTLLSLLNIYENISFKVRISIILGNFYKYIVIPNEGEIIVEVLINYLKERSDKDEDVELMASVLNALVNISIEENKNMGFFFRNGITPLLLPLINSSDANVWKKTVHFLSNICSTNYDEIINCDIFDVFHKKLLEISPSPPQKIISLNYCSIHHIVTGINNLLFFGCTYLDTFFKTPLIPLLLHTLDSTISIRSTSSSDEDFGDVSSDQDIDDVQLSICNCFFRCSIRCYEDNLLLVEMKVIDSLLNIIEMYITEIKRNKILLNEATVRIISQTFFEVALHGSCENKNEFKNYFDENNRLNVLINLFEFLTSQTLSPIQKEIINYISITVCFLLKNETPPLCYICVLKHVNSLKSSPSPVSGYDFPSEARISWYQMSKADECLWNSYQFKEMIVVEGFEVENGVLGLDRDVYLSLVKYLDSSIVRKVWLNIFVLFCSIFYFSCGSILQLVKNRLNK